MKLEPGYYKIQKRSYSEMKVSRGNNNAVELLRVVGTGEKQMLYFDHDVHGTLATKMNFAEEYEIVSKYEREPKIASARLTMTFTDTSGQRFDWSVTDAWALRNVFEANPWMKEAFNFKPAKKR